MVDNEASRGVGRYQVPIGVEIAAAWAWRIVLIGGAGYLYGGLIGAAAFIVLRDVISAATPEYWEFWIGALLIALVLTGRERVRDAAVRAVSLLTPKGARRRAA